ncbi:hypothetical protein K470DRAFT_260382 [Piedraia hortae CBS 480.64]|uniref:Cyclic-AMP phosphodiesterase n=1 Tax=Piedraia hortae CBS 480.64 TaxID=1314780 RepID=A0A6A7BRR4_9PEZI|nr:hypothetical protein K470DRAFT_260382 [Piedraia hortae CBS 480.64]
MRLSMKEGDATDHGHDGNGGPGWQGKPALQVICLGASGGPSEEGVTGFLVRSVESAWARGSLLAVDAGSHLGPITRILERDFPLVADAARSDTRRLDSLSPGPSSADESKGRPALPDDPRARARALSAVHTRGPFAGAKLPNASARANALHILRSYISTYLITHPHLDHVSGFAINTAAFHATSRPKTLAALPSTVDAIKRHIFNDVIWPNLSDEDGGVGFVTFQRLKEGGDVMMGEGEGRGYLDVVDGLGVRAFKVSHGVCTKSPPSHHHRGSIGEMQPLNGDGPAPPPGRSFSSPGTPRASIYGQQQSPRVSMQGPQASPGMSAVEGSCVVDSTAFFLRDTETSREILMFGDVEADSLSLAPRNRIVWQEAARKVMLNSLGGIFIECSYDDSQADAILFGHLCPRHVVAELQTLASFVTELRTPEQGGNKRKRSTYESVAQYAVNDHGTKRSRSWARGSRLLADSRRYSVPDPRSNPATPEPEDAPSPFSGGSPSTALRDLPLAGIRVYIIHIKDPMKDGPPASDRILAQLRDHEAALNQPLGCEFVIARSGESYWF